MRLWQEQLPLHAASADALSYSEAFSVLESLVHGCGGSGASSCSGSVHHHYSRRAEVTYPNGDTYAGAMELADVRSSSLLMIAGGSDTDAAAAARPVVEWQRSGLGLYNFAAAGMAYLGCWSRGRPHGDGILFRVRLFSGTAGRSSPTPGAQIVFGIWSAGMIVSVDARLSK